MTAADITSIRVTAFVVGFVTALVCEFFFGPIFNGKRRR